MERTRYAKGVAVFIPSLIAINYCISLMINVVLSECTTTLEMKGFTYMKKISFLLLILLITIVSGYAIYNYRSSMIYSLEGSYQAEVLNTREEEIGIYTINFQDDKVGLFSAYFDESITGNIRNLEDNHYELVFDEFTTECTVLSKDEIQLNIYEQDYIFNKKSDVPIWEKDFKF